MSAQEQPKMQNTILYVLDRHGLKEAFEAAEYCFASIESADAALLPLQITKRNGKVTIGHHHQTYDLEADPEMSFDLAGGARWRPTHIAYPSGRVVTCEGQQEYQCVADRLAAAIVKSGFAEGRIKGFDLALEQDLLREERLIELEPPIEPEHEFEMDDE